MEARFKYEECRIREIGIPYAIDDSANVTAPALQNIGKCSAHRDHCRRTRHPPGMLKDMRAIYTASNIHNDCTNNVSNTQRSQTC
jgi:hypothetical protein